MFQILQEGGAYLVAHLIISSLLIIGYIFLAFTGHSDETLKSGLLLVLGYWFGALANATKKSPPNNGNE